MVKFGLCLLLLDVSPLLLSRKMQKQIEAGSMDCDVEKKVGGGGEKRSGSPVVADPAASKKKHRSELVEESIVETETDEESQIDEEPMTRFPLLPDDEEEMKLLLQRVNEKRNLQRGLKWTVYRFMVHEDDKEKFISLVESLNKDYNKENNSLIEYFEGPPKCVMVAVEANTLDTKTVVGFSEIVDQFYGVSQNSNQDKVTARLLFFESEVMYLLNRRKIQRLAVSQHCNINIYTSGFPSCDIFENDIIVGVEGKHHDVCTTLVEMLSVVYDEFRYDKSRIHSMEMMMRDLPTSGLLHEVQIYGKSAPKMMASYEDGKEMMPIDYHFIGKSYIRVHFPLGYANLLTREEGKLINSIRGPLNAEFEVSLTYYGCTESMKFIIFGKSMSVARDALETFVKELRDMGDVQALELADIVENRGFISHGWFDLNGIWGSDDDDDCWW